MSKRPILVVEDDQDDIQLIRTAFQAANVPNPLVFSETAQQALDYLHQQESGNHVQLPCLILLDLALPDKPGFDVLQAIRKNQRTRRIPTIVLSASENKQDIVSAYRLGGNSFIAKGFSFEELKQKIAHFTAFWLHTAKLPTG